MLPVSFVGAAYKARSSSINTQRCVNLFLEPGGPDAKSPAALIGTPGLRRLQELPNAPAEIRGLQRFKKRLFVVSGNKVYSFNEAWERTEVGTIGTSTGPVSTVVSTSQMMLVDGATGYVYDEPSNAFVEITDVEFPKGARRASYLDGMGIVESTGTEQFSFSKIGDFRQWDGLDFASAEGAPDNIVSHIVDHRELWLFGESTTEIYVNTSDGLARNGNAFVEVGCAAAFSPAKLDNSIMWLGRDEAGQGTIWRAQDYRPVRVSDFGVEFAIGKYSRIDDAIAYRYQQDGHLFYVLTFPTADATWVYDVATNSWHERAGLRTSDGSLHRHRSNCHEFFAGVHVVGDFENGRMYALDLNVFDDDGVPQMALRQSATLAENQRQIFYGTLQVDIEPGVGLADGQGADPKMMLRYSDDAGRTYSNRRESTMGKIGETLARCRWNRLGRGRNRVWEVSITDPVKRIITGAYCVLGMGS